MFANSKVYFLRFLQMLRLVALIYSLTQKSAKMKMDRWFTYTFTADANTGTWFEEFQKAVGPDIAVGVAWAFMFFDAAHLWQNIVVMAVYGTLMHS